MRGRYCSAFAGSLALHLAVIAGWLWPFAFRVPQSQSQRAATGPPLTVFVVPQEDQQFPGLKPVDAASAARIRSLNAGSRVLTIGGFTFNADKLFARASVLFPFVSPGLSLDHFAIGPSSDRVLVYQRPSSRENARARAETGRALILSDAAVQAIVDKAWSRRERWDAFAPIRALAASYSAEAGALPPLFQRYTDQNALQPYQDVEIRDPRFWTQLGLAADHVVFIGFIREYAEAHPGTRGAIELLFLLDRIAEANEDALQTLLDGNPEEDLRWTRASNRAAYGLALQLRVHYRSQLSRLGLNSRAAVARHYDGVRLAILEGILRTTPGGYRSNDARFLMGAIYWRQGRSADAIGSWRGITLDPADSFAAANAQLIAALHTIDTSRAPAEAVRQISRVLKNEQGRWIDFSYARLKRFGYRFDSY